jgi:hypothetical protein
LLKSTGQPDRIVNGRSRRGEDCIIGIFYSYGDESGIHESAAYCSMCGFVSTPESWKVFARRWKRVLRKYGVSAFHAKDFMGRKRRHAASYKEWDERTAKSFLAELVGCADTKKLLPFGLTVETSAFHDLSEEDRKLITAASRSRSTGKWASSGAPNQPWAAAWVGFVASIIDYVGPRGRVHFIFDQQEQYEGYAHTSLEEARQLTKPMRYADRIGRMSFESSTKCTPLQLADLLVYSWNKDVTLRQFGKRRERDCEYAMSKLMQSVEGFPLYDSKGLEAILSRSFDKKVRGK